MQKRRARITLDGYPYRDRRDYSDRWFSMSHEERSEIAKRRIARYGGIGKGPLWTAEEDATVRELWPDRDLIVTSLKRRTRRAIGSRGITLGIAGKNHTWTPEEVLRLRKLYPRTSVADMRKAFNGASWLAIRGKAQTLKLFRPAFKTKWLRTDQRLLNEIRDRAKEFNYSVQDVLDLAGIEPRHKSIFHQQQRPTPNQLDAMVKALGGRIVVEWID